MKPISKAAMIRQRYAELAEPEHRKARIIAGELDCSPEYVRVVVRQRLYAGLSQADIRYRSRPEIVAKERAQANERCKAYYRNNPEYRRRQLELKRARYRAMVEARGESP